MAGHKQIQLEHPIYSNCWWKFLENQCSSNRHQTRHWPLALKYLSCPFMEHFSSTNGLFPPKKQNKTKKTTTVVCSKPLLHIVHCKQMRNVFFCFFLVSDNTKCTNKHQQTLFVVKIIRLYLFILV